MNPEFLTVRNEASAPAAEVMLYGPIGDTIAPNGIKATDFKIALDEIDKDKPIIVHINSPGGNVWDGMAIYNMLRSRTATVTCQVDGVAASAASFIACAAHKVIIPETALMMIHQPIIGISGNAADLRREAQKLDAHGDAIAGIYMLKTGKTKKQIMDAMDEETWMTGSESVAFGLADELIDEPSATALATRFDLSRFKNCPENVKRDLTLLTTRVRCEKAYTANPLESKWLEAQLLELEAKALSLEWLTNFAKEHGYSI